MTPYYEDDACTIYHGDCREIDEWVLATSPISVTSAVLLTDPPFGIAYESGHYGSLPRAIAGDDTTAARDAALAMWGTERPALVFGSWKQQRPAATRMVLVWDTKGALGMGDLSLPWKPAHQEIYVLNGGFHGPRTSDVITCAPVQAKAANGRTHPHEKPVALMHALLAKCPEQIVVDPFMGTGASLVAAKAEGRRSVGVELDERYCEIAARRLGQEVLDFGVPA